MKFLLKSFGYLFVLLLLLLLSVVALVRFRPDWLVAGANQVQDLAQVDAEGLVVNFAPFTLSVADLKVAMEAQDIAVNDASTSVNLSAWWTDQPFWHVDVERVHIDQHPTTEEVAESGAVGVIDIMPFITFNKVRIGTLTVSGEAPLKAQLNAVRAGQEIELLAAAEVAQNPIEIKGTLVRGVDDLGFDLRITSTPADSTAVVAQLQGTFSSKAKFTLDVANGSLQLEADGQTHRVDKLSGELAVTSAGGVDQLVIEDFGGNYLGPNWSEALAVSVQGRASQPAGGLDVKAAITAGATKIDVSTDPTSSPAAWRGRVRIGSDGLPSSIATTPYQSKDLFPLKLTTSLAVADGEFVLDDLDLETPANALSGAITFSPGKPLKLIADLDAERLYLPLIQGSDAQGQPAELQEAAAKQASKKPVAEQRVFSTEPIDWTWLETGVIDVNLDAAQLRLQEAEFQGLRIRARNDAGRLAVKPFTASLGKGGFDGEFSLGLSGAGGAEAVDQSRPVAAGARLKVDGVALESFGFVPQEELRGGVLEVDLDLRSTGNSAHDLAGGLNGKMLILVEQATLMNDFIELAGSDLLMEILSKLNPFVKKDPTTELQCALILFNADKGVLRTKNQLVLETTKMEIVGSGKVDLGKERLNLTLAPNAKSGIGVNVGSLVKFLKLGGTLTRPRPTADAVGALKSGLAVGAAISTGGASVLAEGLAKRVLNAGSACEAARSGKVASSTPQEKG